MLVITQVTLGHTLIMACQFMELVVINLNTGAVETTTLAPQRGVLILAITTGPFGRLA